MDNAILRLASMGGWIARQAASGDSLFQVHGEENHAAGFFAAAAEPAGMRAGLI